MFLVGHGIGNMTSIKLNLTRLSKMSLFSRATLYRWSFIFLVNSPIKFYGFSCHFPFFWNEEWKERYCILTRVIPFGRMFFFFFLFFLGFVVHRPRTPRPRGQRYYYMLKCVNVFSKHWGEWSTSKFSIRKYIII